MTKYYIYIVSNAATMLYVGLTNDLERILVKHRKQKMASFKGNFSFDTLVYVEETFDINYALEREIKLKKTPDYLKKELLRITNPSMECMGKYWERQLV